MEFNYWLFFNFCSILSLQEMWATWLLSLMKIVGMLRSISNFLVFFNKVDLYKISTQVCCPPQPHCPWAKQRVEWPGSGSEGGHSGSEHGLLSQITWIQIPALPLNVCLTLGKLPQFPSLWSGMIIILTSESSGQVSKQDLAVIRAKCYII